MYARGLDNGARQTIKETSGIVGALEKLISFHGVTCARSIDRSIDPPFGHGDREKFLGDGRKKMGRGERGGWGYTRDGTRATVHARGGTSSIGGGRG